MDFKFEGLDFQLKEFNDSLVHLPSWRYDLVPDGYLDLITAVFVLPEINEFALLDFIDNAKRALKTGGFLHVRDHLYTSGNKNHLNAHKINTEDLLNLNGFKLIYQVDYKDNVDIYGIPRVYQYK